MVSLYMRRICLFLLFAWKTTTDNHRLIRCLLFGNHRINNCYIERPGTNKFNSRNKFSDHTESIDVSYTKSLQTLKCTHVAPTNSVFLNSPHRVSRCLMWLAIDSKSPWGTDWLIGLGTTPPNQSLHLLNEQSTNWIGSCLQTPLNKSVSLYFLYFHSIWSWTRSIKFLWVFNHHQAFI